MVFVTKNMLETTAAITSLKALDKPGFFQHGQCSIDGRSGNFRISLSGIRTPSTYESATPCGKGYWYTYLRAVRLSEW